MLFIRKKKKLTFFFILFPYRLAEPIEISSQELNPDACSENGKGIRPPKRLVVAKKSMGHGKWKLEANFLN